MTAISIIIPVYNTAAYLQECLDSIENQTFTDWKCICIDDGSTDESGAILEEYAAKDPRLIVRHKLNGGVTSAREMGVALADTPFLCFVDADDCLPSHALQTLVQHQQASGAEIVRGNFAVWDGGSQLDNDTEIPTVPYSRSTGRDGAICYRVLPGECFMPKCFRACSLNCTLFSRNLFEGASVFPPYHIKMGEDGLTLFKLLFRTTRMVFVPDIVYWYRCNEQSASHMVYADYRKDQKCHFDYIFALSELIEKYHNRGVDYLKYHVANMIYTKFIRDDSFAEQRPWMRQMYWLYFCWNLRVQHIAWKFSWKIWLKMWLASRWLLIP